MIHQDIYSGGFFFKKKELIIKQLLEFWLSDLQRFSISTKIISEEDSHCQIPGDARTTINTSKWIYVFYVNQLIIVIVSTAKFGKHAANKKSRMKIVVHTQNASWCTYHILGGGGVLATSYYFLEYVCCKSRLTHDTYWKDVYIIFLVITSLTIYTHTEAAVIMFSSPTNFT